MKAEIIATGSELLIHKRELNALLISQSLASIGIEVSFITLVGDQEEDLEKALQTARSRVALTIITGGLGPTTDDITKKIVARVTNKRLILRDEVLKKISERLESQGKKMTRRHEGLALMPAQAKILENPIGTAPAFLIQEEKKLLICLPGVPKEIEAIIPKVVLPTLKSYLAKAFSIQGKRFRTTGLVELQIEEILKGLALDGYPIRVGLIAQTAGVDIQIQYTGSLEKEGKAFLEEIEQKLKSSLGEALYGYEEETLEIIVGRLLTRLGLTLAVAESCTGGLMTHLLTNISGSSNFLEQSIVSYSNRSKEEFLGVSSKTLQDYGAVSLQTAKEMAKGIRKMAQTDLGFSITGIAGPTGGTSEKPIGLVHMALSDQTNTRSFPFQFHGDRITIKWKSAQAALNELRKYLRGGIQNTPSMGHRVHSLEI